jgi:hypothetical protein
MLLTFLFFGKNAKSPKLRSSFYIYIYIYLYIYITSKRQFSSRKWLEVAQLGGVLVVHGATILDSHRVTHLMA